METVGIDQNVETWVQNIKMSNWSKCCNLSEKVGFNQNFAIWVQNSKLIKMLWFECNINENAEIWMK